jgi:hypothetical protein
MSSGKLEVNKDQPHIIRAFIEDLNNCISEIRISLYDLFNAFRTNKITGKPREYALRLFDEWIYGSQLPKFSEVLGFTKVVFEKSTSIKEIHSKLIDKLPFGKKVIERFVDGVEADRKRGGNLEDVLIGRLWEVYETNVSNFLQQTAHVIISRLLLYKVGLDKKVFDQITLPTPPRPYLKFYNNVRESMEKLASGIYFLSEFDWWYIPDVYRGTLSSHQQVQLHNIEDKLDVALAHANKILETYNFAYVDRDVWKDVYLFYLSEDERRRLGFVPTPDEIVELILDLVGYDESCEGLCQKKMLDPACGSGTFLVEAILRLRRHLEHEMPCHVTVHMKGLPEWERKKRMLDIITEAIHGVDIHPFATFLTALNLLFQLLDLYAEVKDHYPNYILRLKVVTHDSLVLEPSLSEYQEELANARLKEAIRRTKEYAEINGMRFHYVVGNPPWGGVLRGKLGPLGDPKSRKEYSKYKGAFGKFDIYVLFIERGLKWLNEGGILGMITQITYLDSGFGRGIVSYIRDNASITHFVDLSELGDVIFPGFTNYPAITIMKKVKPSCNVNLIRIKVGVKKS